MEDGQERQLLALHPRFRQLGLPGFEPCWMQFAKFSPDGTKIAYVYKNNLYVESLADGTVRQLTSDGNDEIINGQFDWVYEEELHQQDGWRWSPDSRSIAYWQFDTRGTGTFYMIDPLSPPPAGSSSRATRESTTWPAWSSYPARTR